MVTYEVEVLVCADECCAFPHLALLRDAVRATPGARLRLTPCLRACRQANVVIVRGRVSKPVRLGRLADEPRVKALCAWVEAGGPDWELMPHELAEVTFPARR